MATFIAGASRYDSTIDVRGCRHAATNAATIPAGRYTPLSNPDNEPSIGSVS